MKATMTMLLGVLAFGGCGGASDGSTTTTPGTTESPSTAAPTAGGVPCAQEVARVCGDGMVDGCGGGLTLVHACVAADTAAGQPCAQEVARVCPDGQVDACLQAPPLAETHVCVAL